MEDIHAKLEQLKVENEELKEDNHKLKIEISQLKQKLQTNSIKSSNDSQKQKLIQQKSKERIDIFRSLFKGRHDVFAYRWVRKDGSAGYSPARKSYSQDFHPLTDDVIYSHLSGKRTIGLYPLLKDNTCWFLAIDFDQREWQNDARAVLKTCTIFNVPACIERSRSGNGCHVWIFFNEPISAELARSFGSFLLSYTVKKRYTTKINSFDRMFPNQDRLTKGKLGNLIALPLQAGPRKKQHSIFVDEDFNPFSDQWLYLSRVKKMSKSEVQSIITENTNDTSYVEENNKTEYVADPKQINIIYKNGIHLSKKEIPESLLKEISEIAKISNPAYYRAKKRRLVTTGIPQTIDCSEDLPEYLKLPRGSMEELLDLLKEKKIDYTLKDQSFHGKSINVSFQGTLSMQQDEALQSLLQNQTGILAATTGFGKTVIASALIANRKVNTLVLVHRKQLINQWQEHLSTFLNIESQTIGQIGGGKDDATGLIDIATIQSFNYNNKINQIENYGQIIVDECHHFSAFSFEKILKTFNSTYIHGLTETPKRKDGLEAIMKMQLGPIRYKVSAKDQAKVRPFKHILIPRFTSYKSTNDNKNTNVQKLYGELAIDENRNQMIFNDVLKELELEAVPIIITERIEHVDRLANQFKGFVKNLFILTGELSKKEAELKLKELNELSDNQERLVIATGKYIGEGFDNQRLDTLFLTNPISWKGTLQQYVGRLHRMHEKKTEVKVYDYIDHLEPALARMYKSREKGYKSLGYITLGDAAVTKNITEQMKLF